MVGTDAVTFRNPRTGFIRSITILALLVIATALFMTMRGNVPEPTGSARITVQHATIVGPLVQHNVPRATVRLKNTGSTTARTVKARLVMTVWTAPTFPDWDMPLQLTHDVQSLGGIEPGAGLSQTVSLVAPLSDVQGMHLERKDWFIVVLGIVSYADTFGDQHETHACFIWRDTKSETMSPCEQWNEGN